MIDDDEEDLTLLRKHTRKADRSVAGRRLRETRPMGYAERRKLSPKAQRTEATFFKFSRSFKQRLIAIALSDGIAMVEVVERSVQLYESRRT